MNIRLYAARCFTSGTIAGVLLMVVPSARAQTVMGALYNELSGSRYARAMRMGDAYTGFADGPEAVHYNTAGLAFLKHPAAAFSLGQGTAFVIRSSAADAVVAVPLPDIGGVAGISHSRIHFPDGEWTTSITSLHYGRKLLRELSAGVDLHYFSYSATLDRRNEANELTTESLNGHAIDASLSVLFRCSVPILGREADFRAGMRIRNVFGSSLHVNDSLSEQLFQTARMGASCRIVPSLPDLDSLIPLALVLSGDLAFAGRGYSFKLWRPNFGIEICVLELLQLSFGRENERKIDDRVYQWSPQFPVNRFGAGLVVPLHRLTAGSVPLELRVDFCKSDWKKIDERRPAWPFQDDIGDEAWSVAVTLK